MLSGTPLGDSLALLATRRYGTFWAASLLSNIGTWAQLVAQPWLLLSLGASSTLLGLDTFAMSAPAWLLMLPGGILADRRDRRWIIGGFQSVQMLCPVAIIVLLATGGLRPWIVIALSLVIGRLSVSGAVTCTAIADSEALHELSDSVALNLLRIAQVATLRARAARETSRITVRLRRLSCGGARLSITADSQWIAADPHSPPESSWEALRYYARRIGAEVVAREAGPAAHRLEVVRRAVRKGEP